MNKITVMGFLARDPEMKLTKNNNEYFKLVVADNVGKEDTIFWGCNYFGTSSKKVISYLKKGSPVVVVGDIMMPRAYQKQDGSTGVGMSLNVSSVSFAPKFNSVPKEGNPAPQITKEPINEPMSF